MSRLHEAVDQAVAVHPDNAEWEALVLAGVRLAAAFVPYQEAYTTFVAAKKAYTTAHPATGS